MKKLLATICLLPCLLFAQNKPSVQDNQWSFFGSVAPKYYFDCKNNQGNATVELLGGIKNKVISFDVYSEPSINLANKSWKYYGFGAESDLFIGNNHVNVYFEPSDIKASNGKGAFAFGAEYDIQVGFANLGASYDKGADQNLYLIKGGANYKVLTGYVGVGESNHGGFRQIVTRQQVGVQLTNSISANLRNTFFVKSKDDQVRSELVLSF